jgi:hypothetical protein
MGSLKARKVSLIAARPAGLSVIIALFSACSSPPAHNADEGARARASGRAANLALQAKEDARLARKAAAKDDALRSVRLAQNACQELTRKTAALAIGSTVGFSALDSFIPPQLYPTDSFAAYVDDATFADVKSQLTQLVDSLVELVRLLERNKPPSITGIERPPDEVTRDRTAFQQGKLKALTSINTYCESIRRAGAGVGPLQ